MKECCEKEARKEITRGRGIATCDGCGRLILGYDNEADFKRTVDALTTSGVAFEQGRQGKLWIVAKERRG